MKPILYNISAFDSTKEAIFEYMYDGNQQYKVSIIIYNNATNVKAYEGTQTTFQLRYVLPANSIPNGSDYTAQITVYDQNNTASVISDKVLFSCFATPNFTVSNITENQVISNSTYTFEIGYSQVNNVQLEQYIIDLFDFAGRIISSGGTLYPTKHGLSYPFMGLLDNTSYKIQAIGKTVGGMEIKTAITSFSVDYISPAMFSVVSLENIPKEASVKIESKISIIEGTHSNPPIPLYINNKEIDTTAPNCWVQFDEGFNLTDDFDIEIECRKIPKNITFFKLSDKEDLNKVLLQKWSGTFDGVVQEYLTLSVKNKVLTYRGISNLIPPLSDTELVIIDIKRINNCYNIGLKRKV